MICPQCGETLKVVVNHCSSEENCKHKVYVKCPKCKSKSSIYHIEEDEDIELAQTAAQRELMTRYEIELVKEDGAVAIPPLTPSAITNYIEEIRKVACNGIDSCTSCPFGTGKNSSKATRMMGMACDMSYENRLANVENSLRENMARIM